MWILKKQVPCWSDILLLFDTGRKVAMKGSSTSHVDRRHKQLQYKQKCDDVKQNEITVDDESVRRCDVFRCIFYDVSIYLIRLHLQG